jgi:hypothetical protein
MGRFNNFTSGYGYSSCQTKVLKCLTLKLQIGGPLGLSTHTVQCVEAFIEGPFGTQIEACGLGYFEGKRNKWGSIKRDCSVFHLLHYTLRGVILLVELLGVFRVMI